VGNTASAAPGHLSNTHMRIFAEYKFEEYRRATLRELASKVQHEERNYILNVNETDYIDHLAQHFGLEQVTLDFDNISASSSEEAVKTSRVLAGASVGESRFPIKHVVSFHESILIAVSDVHDMYS
jgi:hypothetical protein